MSLLYADENFNFDVVEGLRRLGDDVLTVQQLGRAHQGIPDEEVLADATARGAAVLTFDRRDYFRLHRERPDHAGIIACTVDPDISVQAAKVHEAIARAGDLAGQVLRVTRGYWQLGNGPRYDF